VSRKYKFYDKGGLYFVSFATVYWIDVFVREQYFVTMLESLDYCRKNKGLEIYCWCIMPSHVHLIIRAKENNPEGMDALDVRESRAEKQQCKKQASLAA